MDFDLTTTAGIFILVIAVGAGGLVAAPFMGLQTVLMMVAPSMVVFGLICLGLGVKYGEYRADAV